MFVVWADLGMFVLAKVRNNFGITSCVAHYQVSKWMDILWISESIMMDVVVPHLVIEFLWVLLFLPSLHGRQNCRYEGASMDLKVGYQRPLPARLF